jgi:hypothetical protein
MKKLLMFALWGAAISCTSAHAETSLGAQKNLWATDRDKAYCEISLKGTWIPSSVDGRPGECRLPARGGGVEDIKCGVDEFVAEIKEGKPICKSLLEAMNPDLGLCQYCESCGGNYPIEAGRRRNGNDWGGWNTKGAACNGNRDDNYNEMSLCCAPDKKLKQAAVPSCKYCKSCGGQYPQSGGKRRNTYDWGRWDTEGAACNGVTQFNHLDEFELCCRGTAQTPPQPQCKYCKSCGGQYTHDGGRRRNTGDWGGWNIHNTGCAAPMLNNTLDEFHLCCLRE